MGDFDNVDPDRVLVHEETGTASDGGGASSHAAATSASGAAATGASTEGDYDYTENASAAEIAQAIKQQKEDEQATIGQSETGESSFLWCALGILQSVGNEGPSS